MNNLRSIMKDDWTYYLKERMADYGETPPEGLWDDIEKALSPAGEVGATRRFPMVRFARMAAVAAVAAIIVLTGYYYDKHTHVLPAFEFPKLSVADREKIRETIIRPSEVDNAESIVTTASTLGQSDILLTAITGNGPEPAEGSGRVEPQPAEVPSGAQASVEITGPAGPENTDGQVSEPATQTIKRMPDPEYPVDDRHRVRAASSALRPSGFGVGLYASNNVAGANPGIGGGNYDLVADSWPGASLGADLGSISSYEMFKNRARTADGYKHHRPFRTGVSLSYALTDRLSLSSGLLYTRHSSDMDYDEGKFYSSGRRTLHYIGIPLSLSYRLYTWQKLDIYASAGAVAEKCVSGRLERRFYDNGELIESESLDVQESRWQWSVNAAAGVQLRLAEHVGLYAEPGVGYYIDNGSDIDNYYKEKPLNLNLNIGFRVTVP